MSGAVARRRDDSGAGTALIAAVALVAVCAMWVAVVLGAYVVAAQSAKAAADLAAVDGARAVDGGAADGCRAAAATASANGGSVQECATSADGVEFVVSVRVAVRVALTVPGLPAEVSASSEAGRTTP
ncbi:Rv3654c family TadE-like protein [Propionicicella superfundia]|uniref:Rv3654c family TadE-like protein n=1 Tax=Propionicicella superfundia TaxID=348582 RepID=UPI0004205FA8|nr:Rv3654c family TadE-like protein [Propionicicella superfundia]